MQFSPDGKFLVSGCVDDRFLSIWDAAADTEGKAAVRSLGQDQEPVALAFNAFRSGAPYDLAVVSVGGRVELYRVDPAAGKAGKPSRPDGTVSIVPGGERELIVAAAFVSATELVVVRGSALRPVFQRVRYADAENDIVSTLLPAAEQESGMLVDTPAVVAKARVLAAAVVSDELCSKNV